MRAPRTRTLIHHPRCTLRLASAAAMLLAVLLAGCGANARSTTNAALPAILVSSVVPSPRNSNQYSTMHLAALNPSNGSAMWSYQADWHPWHRPSAPVAADSVVYTLSDTIPTSGAGTGAQTLPGDVVALRERDGKQLWTVHVGFLATSPIVANGVVYVGALSSSAPGKQVTSFYALRASDGQQVWRTDLTAQTTAGSAVDQGFGVNDSMQLVDGVLYVTSNPTCSTTCGAAYVLALRDSDGKQLWKVAIENINTTIAPPTIADGRLFVSVPYTSPPTYHSRWVIAAYSALDGKALWTSDGFGPGSPVVSGGYVYAHLLSQRDTSNPDSPWSTTVVALDESSGTPRWRFTADVDDTDVLNAVLAAGDSVYVQSHSVSSSGSASWWLSALSPGDGTVRWRAPLPGRLDSAQVTGGVVYGLSGGERLQPKVVAVGAGDGHVLWSVALPPPPAGPDFGTVEVLGLSGGVLYTAYSGLENGRFMLIPLRASDGTVLWKSPGNGTLGGATVVVP